MVSTRADNLATLRALSAKIRSGPAVEAVRAGLAVLEAGVTSRCPVGETRKLVDSIHTEGPTITKSGVSGAVVVGSDHALANEYGTHDRAAHPFVRPTLDADGPRAIQAMTDTMRRARP